MRRRLLYAASILVACLWLGCGKPTSPGGLPIVQVKIGSKDFYLEVANTNQTRRQGLMFRQSLPANQGMIFVFEVEEPLTFYMKNTPIPLDIIYLDASGRVVSIHRMKPFELTSVPSDKPAKYAIELNAGAAYEAGVHVGERVAIPQGAREAEK